jgi:hypothetical protein
VGATVAMVVIEKAMDALDSTKSKCFEKTWVVFLWDWEEFPIVLFVTAQTTLDWEIDESLSSQTTSKGEMMITHLLVDTFPNSTTKNCWEQRFVFDRQLQLVKQTKDYRKKAERDMPFTTVNSMGNRWELLGLKSDRE